MYENDSFQSFSLYDMAMSSDLIYPLSKVSHAALGDVGSAADHRARTRRGAERARHARATGRAPRAARVGGLQAVRGVPGAHRPTLHRHVQGLCPYLFICIIILSDPTNVV